MTNEEAISRLLTIDGWGEREHEAIAMAIDALEQEKTNCSEIPNNSDNISRQQAIDKIKKRLFETAFNNIGIKQNVDETLADVAENRLEKWFDELPSAQPDIIRCKDCAYCDSDVVDSPYGMTNKVWWCDRLYAGANENLIVEPDDFCSFAERREDATD